MRRHRRGRVLLARTQRELTVQLDHPGSTVIWLTGPPCAGKTTLSGLISRALRQCNVSVEVFDGDVLRRGPCADLGYSAADRAEQARRVAMMARDAAARGAVPVVALVSPTHEAPATARAVLGAAMLEVHVDAAPAVCAARDVKGLYARARRGEVAAFTGVSAPYERPAAPDLRVTTDHESPAASCERILGALAARDRRQDDAAAPPPAAAAAG